MNPFYKSTAQAWGLSHKKVRKLHDWVEDKIEPQRRSIIFTSLLRKEYQTTLIEPVPEKLTKEYIESKRHTKAQLAAWGISWPPPKGWKKKLIKEGLPT